MPIQYATMIAERVVCVKSKTKYLLTEADIENIFSSLRISDIKSASPLGLGMFNAVYSVVADKEYVLKIAPKSDIPVMTYEKNMLKTELYQNRRPRFLSGIEEQRRRTQSPYV